MPRHPRGRSGSAAVRRPFASSKEPAEGVAPPVVVPGDRQVPCRDLPSGTRRPKRRSHYHPFAGSTAANPVKWEGLCTSYGAGSLVKEAIARRGAAAGCAALMLVDALRKESGFLRRSMHGRTVSIVVAPSETWVQHLCQAWSIGRDSERPDSGVAVELSDDVLCAPDTETGSTDDALSEQVIIVGGDKDAIRKATDDYLRAIHRGFSVVGISHRPEDFLPGDMLLAEDQRLSITAPGTGILASLAAALATSTEKPTVPLPDIPAELAAEAHTMRPTLLELARKHDQSAASYVGVLTGMVERETSAAQRRSQQAVTLKDLPGIGKAADWGSRMAEDLRAYSGGMLAWSEMDRGVVLEGPPGCGKSTFARALANTSGVSFMAASHAHWQGDREGHLGHMLGAMRRTFDEARAKAPCILLLDEIDSFPARSSVTHDHRDYVVQTVNALLEQLDGLAGRGGVVVVGTCNNASGLDRALLRPGRLERVIRIRRPDTAELRRMFHIHLAGSLPKANLSSVVEAALARGAVGADVEGWCRGAKAHARRLGRRVRLGDLCNEVGEPPRLPSAETIRMAAIHEAGHVLGYAVIEPALVRGVSVRADGGREPFTEIDFSRWTRVMTRSSAMAFIRAALAGRAAEKVLLGEASAASGGPMASDLALATQLACKVVGALGLDEHPESLVHHMDPQAPGFTAALLSHGDLRARVAAMLAACHDDAVTLVRTNRDGLERMANALVLHGQMAAHDALALLQPFQAPAAEARRPSGLGQEAVP